MRKIFRAVSVLALACAIVAPAFATTVDTGNGRLEQRLNGEVRHALVMIPQFTIFDNLAYHVDGNTVTLFGQVRNAVIKDVAEKSVKRLEGVDRVDNRIEVLPASFNDDRIRSQVARAVFGDARLSSYATQPVPPIHIIVKNGQVDLVGVVRTQADKNTAFIRANGVPGVFSVKNDLQVEQQARS
jgi:osmotically-inducible protein OsmY